MTKRLLMIAGETSGDLHGARLLQELRARSSGDLEVCGLGGELMRARGLEPIADVSAISVMGIAEVLRVYSRAKEIFDQILDRVRSEPPDLAVLIDFPEFNLRLAPKLKEMGVPVVYYVSPQVWAWRRGRVKSMARCIDRMLVFFPFEVEFYRGHVSVCHVGHPLVDEVPELDQAWDHVPEADGPFRIALLPGSRSNEVRRLLPVLLEAVRLLQVRRPGMEVLLVQAAALDPREADRLIAKSGVTVRKIAEKDRYREVASAHLALCASGTATLEVGLLRTPMVVVYRIGLFSYWLGRLIVRVPHISLVNLVLGAPAVPELIQGRAHANQIADEAQSLLNDRKRRDAMRADLSGLRAALGEPGAAARAADEVLELLRGETR